MKSGGCRYRSRSRSRAGTCSDFGPYATGGCSTRGGSRSRGGGGTYGRARTGLWRTSKAGCPLLHPYPTFNNVEKRIFRSLLRLLLAVAEAVAGAIPDTTGACAPAYVRPPVGDTGASRPAPLAEGEVPLPLAKGPDGPDGASIPSLERAPRPPDEAGLVQVPLLRFLAAVRSVGVATVEGPVPLEGV